MAHSAQKEDYQRLSLRFVRSLDGTDPLKATREYASFGRRFAQDRDALPQTDADRAFHLVALATEIVDYELPFSTGEAANALIERGKGLLDEALALDASCFDALRMRSSTQMTSVGERVDYLKAEEPRVRAACEAARDAAGDEDPDRGALAGELAMRPYYRWLATLAEEELICGRNRACAEVCRRLLEIDPSDISDARFTLAYALAKLEDEAAFEELLGTYHACAARRPADDAWVALARIAFAHKRHNTAEAEAQLRHLLASYPNGAVALIRQNELPDGEFARITVAPYSEDELVVALSEAVVLLQEGNDRSGKGVLGLWLAEHTAMLRPHAVAEARMLEAQIAAAQAQAEEAGETGSWGAAGGAGGPGAGPSNPEEDN